MWAIMKAAILQNHNGERLEPIDRPVLIVQLVQVSRRAFKGYLRVPLKGYYKGSFKGLYKGLEFPKIGGYLILGSL